MAKDVSLTFDAKLERFRSETSKAAQSIRELEKRTKALAGELSRGTKAAEKQAQAMKSAGRAGKKAAKGTKSGFADMVSGHLAGIASISGAIAMLQGTYATWQKNIRETSKEARNAAAEMIAFAALQEGGTKAENVRRSIALMNEFGVGTQQRGLGFNTIQALQAARGNDFNAGLAAARTVFAGVNADIPLEAGRELEVLGASQGQAPGDAIRRAFIAGQASSRDPAILARAAPALKFFQDKDVGFAMAAQLAATLKPEQLETYTKRAGIALSGVSSAARGTKTEPSLFERLGVQEATQLERLQALAKAGLDTPEKLKAAGFTEQRGIEALAGLVPKIDTVIGYVAEIKDKNVIGILGQARADVEKELPTTRVAREIGILETEAKNMQAIGPRARAALEAERIEMIRGVALRRMGREQVLGFDLIDEQGRATIMDEMLLQIVYGQQAWFVLQAAMQDVANSTKRMADAAVGGQVAQPSPATMANEGREGESTVPVGGIGKGGAFGGQGASF